MNSILAMKQKKHLSTITGLFIRTVIIFSTIYLLTFTVSAQEESVNDLAGDWEVNATWDPPNSTWDVGVVPTSGINRWATINGDVFVSGSLNFILNDFANGLTIAANDTLTVFGDLTFTAALMTLDVQGVLKVYGNLDTNGSTVNILGDGTIVISGNLVIDGGSTYSDVVGGDDLYVDGTITGTGNGGDFTDLNTNQPVLHAEVVTELPVTLVGFDVYAEPERVRLAWATASEENFDFFDIQRSKDGKNYESIGEVEGSGNSTQLINYTFSDNHPYSGISYYRLKAVDYDGSFEIFESKRADISFGGSQMSLYPNPILRHTSGLRVDFQAALSNKTISIYNALGQLMVHETIAEGANFWSLDQGLPKGLYHIKAQLGNQTLVKKFLVN